MPIFTPGFDTERYISLLMQSDELKRRWAAIRDYRAYYAGDQPAFLTPRQKEYLGPLLTESEHSFVFNVCKPVVDTLRERIMLQGLSGQDATGEALADRISDWWERSGLDALQITVHRRTLRDGASYLIISWDEQERMPRWSSNHAYDGAEGVTFHRDPETNEPLVAVKYWQVDNPLSEAHGRRRRTVYLPDRILRYQEDPAGRYGWSPLDPKEGPPSQWWTDTMKEGGRPLGLACVEFRNPGGVSELSDIMGPQNAVNKAYLDLQAAADAAGFQRIVISYTGGEMPVVADDEDSTADDLTIGPGMALELFNGSTANVLPPGDLNQLINTLRTNISAVSAVSRTPQYYLWPHGGSEVPSGEALKQLESALEARANERTTLFGPSWVTALRLGARLYRAMGSADVDPEGAVRAQWDSVSVRNEFIDGQVAKTHKDLGVPEEALWSSKLGYSQDEVESFKRMKANAEASRLAAVIGGLNLGTGPTTPTSGEDWSPDEGDGLGA